MIEKKIRSILYSAAAIDSIKGNDNNYRSYTVQLMISSIKSLIPSKESNGVNINFERLKNEIELLKDYYTSDPLEIIDLDSKNYWDLKSTGFESLLIPIILSNEKFENTKEEIIKLTLFLTGDIYVLIQSILLGKLLDIVIKDELDLEDIVSNLKEEVIRFSQIDYLEKYSKYYKISIKEYSGNFTIDFEKAKIYYINLLNNDDFLNQDILIRSFNILDANKNIDIDEIFLAAIIGLHSEEVSNIEYNNKEFIKRISDYIIRLRKGRINITDLSLQSKKMPDIFSFKIGDIIDHPILNKSKLINRYMDKDKEVIELITKSGLYKFQK